MRLGLRRKATPAYAANMRRHVQTRMHAEPLAQQQSIRLVIADNAPLCGWNGKLRAGTAVSRHLRAVALQRVGTHIGIHNRFA